MSDELLYSEDAFRRAVTERREDVAGVMERFNEVAGGGTRERSALAVVELAEPEFFAEIVAHLSARGTAQSLDALYRLVDTAKGRRELPEAAVETLREVAAATTAFRPLFVELLSFESPEARLRYEQQLASWIRPAEPAFTVDVARLYAPFADSISEHTRSTLCTHLRQSLGSVDSSARTKQLVRLAILGLNCAFSRDGNVSGPNADLLVELAVNLDGAPRSAQEVVDTLRFHVAELGAYDRSALVDATAKHWRQELGWWQRLVGTRPPDLAIYAAGASLAFGDRRAEKWLEYTVERAREARQRSLALGELVLSLDAHEALQRLERAIAGSPAKASWAVSQLYRAQGQWWSPIVEELSEGGGTPDLREAARQCVVAFRATGATRRVDPLS